MASGEDEVDVRELAAAIERSMAALLESQRGVVNLHADLLAAYFDLRSRVEELESRMRPAN